jgi:predicted acylesterase/phospholipase RssA
MSNHRPSRRKTHLATERPPFERIALILQGGGALGSYQAGVYQALAEAKLAPDWVAGISIGALNSALIAGNPPQKRVEKLREFWEAITTPPSEYPISNGSISKVRSPTAGSIKRVHWARSWAARRIFSNRECRRLTSIRTARSKPSAITMSHR